MAATHHDDITFLEPDRCWARLGHARVGRLAISVAGRPDVFPVNFVVDHGTVVFRTAEGTKFAAGALGRPVAFEVDGYDRPAVTPGASC